MLSRSLLIVALLISICNNACAQMICAPLVRNQGFGELNLLTLSERALPSSPFDGVFQGSSTLDPVHNRYIYVRRQDGEDDVVILDANNGNELLNIPVPRNSFLQPEYCIADNTIYSLSINGFNALDISTGAYRTIRTYAPMSISLGMSTFSQRRQTYFAGINQQLAAIDIKTGNRTFYSFPVMDFEVDDSSGMVYGRMRSTLFSLNLETGEIKVVTDQCLSTVFIGSSTYNQAKHEYIEENVDGNYIMLTRINVLTGEIIKTPLSYQYINPEYYDSARQLIFFNSPWTIFPNPVRDQLHISLPDPAGTVDLTVEMMDITGKYIGSYRLHISSSNDATIDMGPLSSGVYLLRITDGNRVQMERVVKE